MSAKILGIDIGSVKICAAMVEAISDEEVSLIAISTAESKGVKKGAITNIELAASAIKSAVSDVLRIAGTQYDRVVVGINGKYIKNNDCKTVVNVPDREINLKQIERLMQDVSYRAKYEYEYEAIHVLPYNFKLDEQDNIEDPLGMSGSRLEVEARIITAQRGAVINLRKAIEKAGLRADNIVLCGYASAIATLNNDEKQLGAALIDMGASTCNLVIHSGNSIRYNKFLEVGSAYITNDLCDVLHTPFSSAEEIKIKLEELIRSGEEKISIPAIGEDGEYQKDIKVIKDIIFARVNEILKFLSTTLDESQYKDLVNAGVVLTGGMTKLAGLRGIANLNFGNLPVRIARPNDIDGLSEPYKDPAYSCAIGLCLYGAGHFTPYEIDSEKKMRYKGEAGIETKDSMATIQEFEDFEEEGQSEESLGLQIEEPKPEPKRREKTVGPVEKIINYIKNLF